MTLVFDRRQDLGRRAATHAFLVGVSEYLFLPDPKEVARAEQFNLTKLASPALSAWEICRWLVEHCDDLEAPLATIRLLMSPSAQEQRVMRPMTPHQGWLNENPVTAIWRNFVREARAWRDDAAAAGREGYTLFYYGGHGLQRFGAPLITLADFLDEDAGGTLQCSCELLANFVGGMAPSENRPDVCRNQFYFIDACREDIVDVKGLSAAPGTVWDPLPTEDDRATPVFMASYPGRVAMNIAGQPTDFCKVLLQALETGAETSDLEDPAERWPVTSFTLNNALERAFAQLGTGQYAPATGVNFRNVRLRWLDAPPPVEFRVSIAPDTAIDVTRLTVTRIDDGEVRTIAPARPDHPYQLTSRAGYFEVVAEADDDFAPRRALQLINQQRPLWPIRMSPP